MPGDWIKLHRKTRKSAVGSDPALMAVWCHLLLEANWETRQLRTGEVIERGQLIIGQSKFANEIGVTRGVLRRCLADLEKCGNITSKSTNAGTMLTIVNYDTYQQVDEQGQPADQPANNQPATNQQPTNNQPATTEEELQELQEQQEGKNIIPPKIEWIEKYARKLDYDGFDAVHFHSHHEARGWVLSNRQKMRDWQAAVVTWQKQTARFNGPKATEGRLI